MFTNLFIHKGFRDSLDKFTQNERGLVAKTIVELELDPKGNGTNLHRVDKKCRDENFWVVRVNQDIRLIIHMKDGQITLLYAGHHDDAYKWAESRVLKFDARKQIAKLVNIIEETVTIPKHYFPETVAVKPFADLSDIEITTCGGDKENFAAIRNATEDSIFDLGLEPTVLESLMNTLTVKPELVEQDLIQEVRLESMQDPEEDTEQEVFVSSISVKSEIFAVSSEDELKQVLLGQWDKWQVFLHPEQKSIVAADYEGPIRVSGSAGTGKTIVALHRANFLLRKNEEGRVLLTTLSPALAGHLHSNFKRLINDKPRYAERIEITSLDDYALRLYKINFGEPNLVTKLDMVKLIVSSMKQVKECKFNQNLVINEWENVVDAFQVKSAEVYTNIERLGRRTRLAETQRKIMWEIMEKVIHELKEIGKITINEMYLKLTLAVHEMKTKPFAHIVVDEAQDLSVAQLKFLVQLGGGVWHPGAGLHGRARTTFPKNSLFFTGDLGQRIFQQPFSWKTFGIDLRGRTKVLKINYRTSQQIRKVADKLLESTITDADGQQVERNHTISAFGGEPPVIKGYPNEEAEKDAVVVFIKERLAAGVKPHEMALFVRSQDEFSRATAVADMLGLSHVILDSKLATQAGSLNIASMHTAKGLEFKAVVVMACDDTIVPSTNYLAHITDEGDLKEAYELERHLLYVACTRARDHLMITGVNPVSEFIDDIR